MRVFVPPVVHQSSSNTCCRRGCWPTSQARLWGRSQYLNWLARPPTAEPPESVETAAEGRKGGRGGPMVSQCIVLCQRACTKRGPGRVSIISTRCGERAGRARFLR